MHRLKGETSTNFIVVFVIAQIVSLYEGQKQTRAESTAELKCSFLPSYMGFLVATMLNSVQLGMSVLSFYSYYQLTNLFKIPMITDLIKKSC